jgi:hypothetical protein
MTSELSSPQELLAVADRSLRAVGRHDRAGWLALFTPDIRIEDPVGSAPHVGHRQAGRYYDTFVGSREITFDAGADFVKGSTVARDLTVNIRMARAVTLAIPAILCYELRETDDGLKISRLQTYSERPTTMLQFARHGVTAVSPGVKLVRALVANQGVTGTAGFVKSFRRPGPPARALVADLFTALSTGDELTTRRMLSHVPKADTDLGGLADLLRQADRRKLIGAGRSVAVSLSGSDSERRGVVIADVDDGPEISRLRFFS